MVAGSILARLQSNRPRLTGVKAWSAWHLRRFDRIEVTDSRLGISKEDFYIAGLSHDYLSQVSSLDLVRVKPL